jgi:predicted nucleotidyltransferase
MRPSDDRAGQYNEQVDKRLYRIPSDERALMFRRIAGMLEAQPDVSFAYAFGSSVTEPAFHDIDIAVYLSDSAGDPRSRALELAEDLERDLEVPVDVQPLNGAPPSFAFHAVRGRLLFSRDDTRLAATIEETVRSYLDVAPFVRQATREAFTR